MEKSICRPRVLLPVSHLKRTVCALDQGDTVKHVIPVKLLVALEVPELCRDAHLCYAINTEVQENQHMLGFWARACAYAASMIEDPDKQRVLYDSVMSLEDMAKINSEMPLSPHEVWRATIIDAHQGGYNAIARHRPFKFETMDKFEAMDNSALV